MASNAEAREQILAAVRAALGRAAEGPVPPVPRAARVAPRMAGSSEAESEMLLSEVEKLGGKTRRLRREQELRAALAELVAAENVIRATLWPSRELQALGLASHLAALGVEIISAQASTRQLATCDLGVTGADAALPETGTLLLRASTWQPRLTSLLPRIHLAIVRPLALRPDLHEVLAEARGRPYSVLVTGPSRTSDIELTLAIGVHGPKALHVWVLD